MKERTCVSRFIEKSQNAFDKKSSLREVLSTIPAYKRLITRVYQDRPMSKNFVHNLATSTFGLEGLAIYEFLRHKGMPLPEANFAIEKVLPVKKRIAYLFSNERKLADTRVEELTTADEQNKA